MCVCVRVCEKDNLRLERARGHDGRQKNVFNAFMDKTPPAHKCHLGSGLF